MTNLLTLVFKNQCWVTSLFKNRCCGIFYNDFLAQNILKLPHFAFLTLTLTRNPLLSHSRHWNSLTADTATSCGTAPPLAPPLSFFLSVYSHLSVSTSFVPPQHKHCSLTMPNFLTTAKLQDLRTAAPPLDLIIPHSISDS